MGRRKKITRAQVIREMDDLRRLLGDYLAQQGWQYTKEGLWSHAGKTPITAMEAVLMELQL